MIREGIGCISASGRDGTRGGLRGCVFYHAPYKSLFFVVCTFIQFSIWLKKRATLLQPACDATCFFPGASPPKIYISFAWTLTASAAHGCFAMAGRALWQKSFSDVFKGLVYSDTYECFWAKLGLTQINLSTYWAIWHQQFLVMQHMAVVFIFGLVYIKINHTVSVGSVLRLYVHTERNAADEETLL